MQNTAESYEYTASLPLSADDAEDEIIGLAVNLARERLIDKTASNQLVSEIIKLGTAKERLQREKLRRENELLKAKTDAIQYGRANEEFYSRVLNALHEYAPSVYPDPNEEDYDYNV